jgi:hypothetical protein
MDLYQLVLVVHLLLYGALADNPTLARVGHNRQTMDIAAPIPASVDVDAYACRVALPNRYVGLIGREVWFYTDTRAFWGPWLVTDIQSDVDAATQPMESVGIAADIDCPQFAHRRGYILTVGWEWRGVWH